MRTNRRDFIKATGAAGAGMITSGLSSYYPEKGQLINIKSAAEEPREQLFNMSGYAAPPLETVRIGFIGLGNRGPGSLRRLCLIEGVEIKAICDINNERLETGQKILADSGMTRARTYGKDEDDWKRMCESDDNDLIPQVTPWSLHAPVSIFAMEHDKHAAFEMPAAQTIEDCWQNWSALRSEPGSIA